MGEGKKSRNATRTFLGGNNKRMWLGPADGCAAIVYVDFPPRFPVLMSIENEVKQTWL